MSERFHTDFAQALRDGQPDTVLGWLAEPQAADRFAVYRNNVVRSAIEALRAAYPAINRLVGDNFFSPLAKSYWHAHPPVSRTMTLYGDVFPAYLATYEPARDLPYLESVAAYDRAWLEAHHTVNQSPLEASRIAALDPAALPSLAPGLHASVRLLRHDWPGFEIWRRNRFETDEKASVSIRPGDHAGLVWRPGGEVRYREISRAFWAFLKALGDGMSLEIAATDALSIDPEFDAAAAFGTALSDGLLRGET